MILINMVMALFKGFSTVGRRRAPFVLTDRDLIKQDLLNEFYTRRGERRMRPTFGSRIWELLMNPMDSSTVGLIREDIEQIVGRDPRVTLLDVTINVLEHVVRADVTLEYVKLGDVDVLRLDFEREDIEGSA
jgi:phage baseplate assembly protein W